MLTAMCAIYSDGGKLPQDRHQLYDRIVDSVLTKRYSDPKRRARVRFELCAIAYAMHTGAVLGEQYVEPLAKATFDEAERALRTDEAAASQKESVLGPRDAREDLLTRSGLLTDLGNRTLGFYHFSIQEFLAAERIFDLRLDDLKSVFVDRAALTGWRNTLTFLFARYAAAFTVASRPLLLLNKLVDELQDDTVGLQLVVVDCAEMLVAKGYDLDPAGPGRLRQRLLNSMTGRPSRSERCEAGVLLGRIGDPRFDPARWFLPTDSGAPLGFLRVNAGPFLMGSDPLRDKQQWPDEQPQHSLELPEFYIAKYSVTVAQFKAFVDASRFVPGDARSLQGVSNHPVVWISWHEALQYCRWLTEKLRTYVTAPKEISLWLDATIRRGYQGIMPSEPEWEKAARGDDGRLFPWGDKFDLDSANAESAINGPSAVGAFLKGTSPNGAADLSGNVWEWTRSLWGRDTWIPEFPYPYDLSDRKRENLAS